MSIFSLIWQLVSLSTFWCVSVYMNSDQGDIFYFLRTITVKSPEWLRKPVIGCINCMASLHTAVVMALYCWLLGPLLMYPWQYLVVYVLVAIITAGTNGIVYKFYDWLAKYSEALEPQETKVD